MAKQIPQADLAAIEEAMRSYPGGASAQQILRALATPLPLRTLQYRLKYLITHDRLVKEGDGRWARYRLPGAAPSETAVPIAQPEQDEPAPSYTPAATPSSAFRRRSEPSSTRRCLAFRTRW